MSKDKKLKHLVVGEETHKLIKTQSVIEDITIDELTLKMYKQYKKDK